MREAELSPPSELTFCLLSFGKGCSSGCFTRSQERSNEIRSRSVWTGRRHHTRRKGSIRLERRTAAPVGGSTGQALWPALLLPPSTPHPPPHLCSPTGVFKQPSITRPRVTCALGPWGGRCPRQGLHLCGGPLQVLGDAGPLRLSRPCARAATGRPRRPAGPRQSRVSTPLGLCAR